MSSFYHYRSKEKKRFRLLVVYSGFSEVYCLIILVFSVVFNSILNHAGKQHYNQRQHRNLPVEVFHLREPVQNHQKEEVKITQPEKVENKLKVLRN